MTSVYPPRVESGAYRLGRGWADGAPHDCLGTPDGHTIRHKPHPPTPDESRSSGHTQSQYLTGPASAEEISRKISEELFAAAKSATFADLPTDTTNPGTQESLKFRASIHLSRAIKTYRNLKISRKPAPAVRCSDFLLNILRNRENSRDFKVPSSSALLGGLAYKNSWRLSCGQSLATVVMSRTDSPAEARNPTSRMTAYARRWHLHRGRNATQLRQTITRHLADYRVFNARYADLANHQKNKNRSRSCG